MQANFISNSGAFHEICPNILVTVAHPIGSLITKNLAMKEYVYSTT